MFVTMTLSLRGVGLGITQCPLSRLMLFGFNSVLLSGAQALFSEGFLPPALSSLSITLQTLRLPTVWSCFVSQVENLCLSQARPAPSWWLLGGGVVSALPGYRML